MRFGKYQLGICDRCGQQFKMSQLRADGDQRGLLVCSDCYDQRWRERPLPPEPQPSVIRPEQPLE